MRACRKGFVDIVNVLLDHGAGMEEHDQYGATALIIASSEFKTQVVKCLIDRGSDPNATDRNGWTAFRWARSMGYVAVTKLLEPVTKV